MRTIVRALVVSAIWVLATSCQSGAALGATCSRGGDCATGVCEFGRCRAGCHENRDCPGGSRCLLDASGAGACSLDQDLGCELGVGRDCPAGLACVADRCEQICTSSSTCPSDADCRAVSGGTAMFCFDTRSTTDGGVSDASMVADAGPSDAGQSVDAGPSDAGPSDAGQSVDAASGCAIESMCFQRTGAACARDCMGRVWCWGNQHGGRLGNGATDGPILSTPTPVVDDGHHALVDVDALACGDGFSCVHVAPTSSSLHAGHVLCWGYQPGDAFDISVGAAVDLMHPIVADAIQLSAALRHACALDRTTHEVLCWGANDALIDPGGMPDDLVGIPTAPNVGLTGAAQIGVASYGACVVLEGTGEVRCWGDNSLGQAGHTPIEAVTGMFDPDVSLTTVRTELGPLTDVRQIAVGYWQRAVLAPMSAGGAVTLSTWGGNDAAEVGESLAWRGEPCDDQRGLGSVCRSVAATPTGSPAFLSIATAGEATTTCGVLAASHHVLCWGDNLHSHAGVATAGRHWIATDDEVQVEGGALLDGVRDDGLFVGAENACAVRMDGSLWCWGPNADSQLARPSDSAAHLAVRLMFPAP